MADRTTAFLATGYLVSSIWVIWVALNSWAQQRPQDRTIRPTLITLGAIVVGVLVAVLLRPWASLAIFIGPFIGGYYLRKGVQDPVRRRVTRIALTVAFVAVLAGAFVLESADLLA